jgi:hypothetical protein
MKHLLIVCGIASTLCLGLVAAQADVAPTTPSQPLHYSRPAAEGLLAQAARGAPNPFITMCLKGCDQEFAACHNRTPNDAGCADRAHTCQYRCRN